MTVRFDLIDNNTLIGMALHALAGGQEVKQQAFLIATGAATSAQDFTIDGHTYELLGFVDSTVDVTGSDLNNTASSADVTIATHGLTVGEYIKVESEYMQVTKVIDANTVRVARGKFGSTKAAHVDTTSIYKNTAAPTAGQTPIPMTDLTTAATVVTDIVAGFNFSPPSGIVAVDGGGNTVVFTAPADGKSRATTETMANGAFRNGATMTAGVAKGETYVSAQTRVIATGEVLPKFAFPFTVKNATLFLRDTDGVVKAYDSTILINGKVVTISNAGSTDAVATDVATILAFG